MNKRTLKYLTPFVGEYTFFSEDTRKNRQEYLERNEEYPYKWFDRIVGSIGMGTVASIRAGGLYGGAWAIEKSIEFVRWEPLILLVIPALFYGLMTLGLFYYRDKDDELY